MVQVGIGIWNLRVNPLSDKLLVCSTSYGKVCVLSNGLWKDVGVMWPLALEQGGGYGEFCFVVFHYFFLH